jgi:methyl-accepting chemotaxis protein
MQFVANIYDQLSFKFSANALISGTIVMIAGLFTSKLTLKFITPICGFTIVSLLVGGYILVDVSRDSTNSQVSIAEEALQAEQNAAQNRAYHRLLAKADIIGEFLSKTAPALIQSSDFDTIREYQKLAAADEDIRYSAYLNPKGEPLLESAIPENKINIIEKSYDIILKGENLGSVLLGISRSGVDNLIADSDKRIEKEVNKVKDAGDAAIDKYVLVMSGGVLVMTLLLATCVYFLFKILVVRPTIETTVRIHELATGGGDLTVRLPVNQKDEIGDLRQSVNDFIQHLQNMVTTIVSDVAQLATESSQLRVSGNELSMAADSQSEESNQVATSVTEMSASVHEVARNSNAAADKTSAANELANNGRKIVDETASTIRELANEVEDASTVIKQLASDSNDIGSVLDVIKGIAEQTNLLALNAAIEAARAGEQGRGFAVVADEVRTLASRTQQSTQEIQEMIQRVQTSASNAVTAMDTGCAQAQRTVEKASEADNALREIGETIEAINSMNSQIATAAVEQTAVAEEINRNIEGINSSSERTAAGATQVATASDHLSELSSRLQNLVSQFKV